MKRVINICLLLTFQLGYLEWAKNHHLFIFQAEAEIFLKAAHDVKSVLHPLIFIPFLGQLLMLYSIFQKQPGRTLTLLALACMSTLMLLILFIGSLTLNVKIAGSALPFVVAAIFALKLHRKRKFVSGHKLNNG